LESRIDVESRIRKALKDKFTLMDGRAVGYSDHILACCVTFACGNYSEANFVDELCSGINSKFWSRLTEALIAQRIEQNLLESPIPKGAGPDFLLGGFEKRVWVEAVCPEPTGLPENWTHITSGEAYSTPHTEIALRWTAAIASKADRVLANTPNSLEC